MIKVVIKKTKIVRKNQSNIYKFILTFAPIFLSLFVK